jgi:PAS domain S-box-containing protein
MADLLPQAIFEADADGRLTYANRQAFVLFGATPEDLAKKPSVLDYLAPEDRERGWRNVVRRLEGDTTVDTAYTAVRRDGTRFPVLILSALMSRDGRATGLRGVIVDMTEQRQAEDELRRASDEWEQTFNATPDLIAIVDREYRIVRANRAMIATFGNGTGSLFGHKCYAVVHGTGAPPASCPHAALLRDGQEHVAEITVARLNRTFSVSASPLRDANGRIWGSVRVARDITERKEIEDAVRRAERRYRDLFEKAPVMYAITRNENGVPVVEDCNDVFLETLGRRREDVVGRSLGEFYTADSLRMMEAGGYRRALNGGFGVEERELLAGDGRSVPVLTTADPRRGDDGRVVGTVAAFLDVSELKRAEEELRRMRGDLCRLDRSARMGEMAAALAHELNPPLTGILSNAQAAQRSLAMKKPDLDEVRSILAGIVADDQRAGEVIRRLRTFLRRDPPEREPVAVNALVLDLLKIVRTDPELRHVTLTTELCDSLPLVRADGVQVQEVILNLVLNAEQAMADGPAVARQIVVSTAPCETGGVLVTVRDRGPGFSPDRIGAPFEPFRSTQSDGMGLGLSICRAIVESHGGRIWAENRPEGGARVSFSLPAAG